MPGTFYIETQTKDGLARIDIAATEVTIPISIVAAEVALPIKIIAQEVAVDINIEAQTVGVYLQPEWAVKEGQDKNFAYYSTDKASGEHASGSYQVPSGKTLFITSIQVNIFAYNVADRDLAQHFFAEAYTDSGNFKVQFGGDGGAVLDFSRSLRVDAGDYVNFRAYNYSNHNCNIGISAQGYEI